MAKQLLINLPAVGMENKEAVNGLVDKAVKAGAKELHEPVEMLEMYARSFKDLDGHSWNVFYMQS